MREKDSIAPAEIRALQSILLQEGQDYRPGRAAGLEFPAKVLSAVLSLAALPVAIGATAAVAGGDFSQVAGIAASMEGIILTIYGVGQVGGEILG